jgi:hypothetical protein
MSLGMLGYESWQAISRDYIEAKITCTVGRQGYVEGIRMHVAKDTFITQDGCLAGNATHSCI